MPLRLLLLVFVLAGLAAAVPGDAVPRAAVVGGGALVPTTPLPDPFPLRRVFVPDESDPRLMTAPGGLRRLTREEFEARVQLAAREVAARANPPRLQEAIYRATYSPGQLVGTAEWRIAVPARRPGFLALDPFALAVGQATWADGRAATLIQDTPTDRATPGTLLWVDATDGGKVSVPWSLRGTEAADEDRFEIVAPAVPMAGWELRLPADRTPVAATAGVLLSGPFPTGETKTRLWRVAAGNVSRWELRVRRPPDAGDPSPLRAARAAKHALAPGSATAVVDFQLLSPGRPRHEWTFQVPAPLTVTDVTGDAVDRWTVDGTALTVRRLDATTTARVRVATAAPLPGGPTTWSCPAVTAVGGTLGADTVEVTVHPDFKLDGWTAHDYRLAGGGVPDARGYRLAFVGSFATGNAEHRRPPSVRVRPAEVELATEESLEWQLSPGRQRLVAVVKARVVRGPVPSVAVQLASRFAVESVTAVPDDPGMTWSRGAANTWTVEPCRPLGTGQTAEFRVEISGPPAPFAGDPVMAGPLTAAVPWPKFTVLGATDRRGTIRVLASGGLRVTRPDDDTDGVDYRGREPDGTVAVTAARPAVAVVAAEFPVADRPAARLTCRADGPVHSVTVFAPGEATVRAETAGASVRRLPVVGTLGLTPLFTSSNGWGAVATAGLPVAVNGSLWRITFPTPERGDFALRFDDLPEERTGRTTRVTLPTVCGADAGAVVARGDEPKCTADALRRAWERFPPSVVLRDAVAPPPPLAPRDIRYADLTLLTSADPDGALSATLSGAVIGGGGRTLHVGLPDGAAVVSAAVAGKRLPDVPTANGTVRLRLPATADSPVSFELRYRLPVGGNALFRRFESPTPALPGDPIPRRWWAFPDGSRPWPDAGREPDPEPRAAAAVWAAPARLALAFSYSLAAVLLGLAVALIRADGRGLVPFAAVGLLLGAAVWGAPGGWPALLRPAFAAVAVGVAGIVLVRPVRVIVPSQSTVTSPVVPLLLLLAVVGVAQAPAPAVVFVVPDEADGYRVFAPPAVLERLEKLTATALPPAVILSASYDAVAGEDAAVVDATFVVLGTRDGPHPLALPLSGVRLARATVNGKDAFPDAPDATRFVVTLPGAGRHELRLRFSATAVRRGADREVRFGVPDVPATTVALLAGPTGRQPEVPTRRGRQKSEPTGGGPRVEADHGGGTTVALRWRDGGRDDGAKPTVGVREFGLWDVGETQATLTAAFAYRIVGGPVNRLRIAVPDGVAPYRVDVRAGDALTTAPRVRKWTVGPPADGWRTIDIRLQDPTDGRLLAVLVGHPTRPLPARPGLRFPRAADVADADRDSYAAVRPLAASVDGIDTAGGVDFPADPLQKEFALPEFRWDAGAPARTVRRDPRATTVELRPRLSPVPAVVAGPSEVAVTVGRRLGYEGLMRSAEAAAVAVEFYPPGGVKTTDARGTDLIGWAQSGGRVQAWFRQPVANAAVRWSAAGAKDVLPPTVPPGGVVVEVPWPRWPTAAGADVLRATVRAAPGFELEPVAVAGQTPIPGAAAGESAYLLKSGGHPPGLFLVKPLAAKTIDLPKPKPDDPPRVAPPSVPPPPATDPPPEEPARRWPHGIVAWCVGYGAALWLARRGRRWRPECAAAVGVLAALAVGWSSVLGVTLFAVAGVGVVARVKRVAEWGWAKALTDRVGG